MNGRHHWAKSAVVAGLLLWSSTAWAGTKEGVYDAGRFSPLTWTEARPIADIGDDVVRMSSRPALGGRAWVIELHRLDDKWAVGEARFLSSDRSTGEEIGRIRLSMRMKDFEALTRRIDAQLAREVKGEGPVLDSEGNVTALVVCADGPGYATERRVRGKDSWLAGSCGKDHPNNAIAALLHQVVYDNVCEWLDRERRCAAFAKD